MAKKDDDQLGIEEVEYKPIKKVPEYWKELTTAEKIKEKTEGVSAIVTKTTPTAKVVGGMAKKVGGYVGKAIKAAPSFFGLPPRRIPPAPSTQDETMLIGEGPTRRIVRIEPSGAIEIGEIPLSAEPPVTTENYTMPAPITRKNYTMGRKMRNPWNINEVITEPSDSLPFSFPNQPARPKFGRLSVRRR